MRVVWTPEAEQDRLAIWDHVVDRDPAAALRMDQPCSAAARPAEFSLPGHAGEVAGPRELTPHRSYRVLCEVEGDTVWILVLIHTARRWPPLSPPRP